jgi:hypothetical protein
MDVNVHETLCNITLRHKVTKTIGFIAVLHSTVTVGS